ncbi:MAG TPA: hypothetical protein VMU47_23480 [Caldimonas sp.]|nr:hypothetical protein [Caldimonas sp.]
MVDCPNCEKPMATLALATTLGVPVQAGQCADCTLLWFDEGSSVRLAPASVLQVFQAIGASPRTPGTALRAGYACPRCGGALAFTHDLQRATRFTYWRCAADRGQLIGYTQFLLEKNFIRPPSADDLATLRREVREIACSQCGAPIDLQKDSMCPFCHAPIALVDPEGVAAAIRDLRAGRPAGTPAPAAAPPSADALHDLQLGAILDAGRSAGGTGAHDLIAIGVGAMLGMLTDLL